MRQVVFVRLSFSESVNFRFYNKEKERANLFMSSKHFIRVFFILALCKLRCLRIIIDVYKIIILPTLVITTPNLDFFLAT
jgi:hypothetical protein